MRPIERELRLRARKLRAARPGVELHQVHPAIGFSATLELVPKRLSDRRLNRRRSWRSWTPEGA